MWSLKRSHLNIILKMLILCNKFYKHAFPFLCTFSFSEFRVLLYQTKHKQYNKLNNETDMKLSRDT